MQTQMLSVTRDGATRDVEILGVQEIMALGGVGDVLTWLKWFRENRDVFLSINQFLSDFQNSQGWAARLAVIGRAIDALQSRFASAPVVIEARFVALAEQATDGYLIPEAVQAEEWGEMEASVSALRVDWGGIVGRLPQLITFVQTIAELIRRFQPATTTSDAAVVAIHGARYQPLALAG